MSVSNALKSKVLRSSVLFAVGFFTLIQAATPFKVLAFYTPYASMGDKAHSAYSLEANTWFPTVAAANGFIYESTTDWNKLNAATLANYKVIMFFDNAPWGDSQRNAFKTYMENGGGWIGFHVCTFNQNPSAWDWYYNQFAAMGSYKNNTWAPTTAVLAVEDATYSITKGFPAKIIGPINEWYAWNNDLRKNSDIKVLCSIHTDSYPLGTGTGSGGDREIWQNNGEYRPIIWTNTKYKMLYSNIGHNLVNYSTGVGQSETFTSSVSGDYAKLILNAIKSFGGVATSIDGNTPKASSVVKINPTISVKPEANFISVSLTNVDHFTATMTDFRGRVVARANGSSGQSRIARTGIGSGAYLIHVASEKGIQTQRVVIN